MHFEAPASVYAKYMQCLQWCPDGDPGNAGVENAAPYVTDVRQMAVKMAGLRFVERTLP